jgi:hypothetical protein
VLSCIHYCVIYKNLMLVVLSGARCCDFSYMYVCVVFLLYFLTVLSLVSSMYTSWAGVFAHVVE